MNAYYKVPDPYKGLTCTLTHRACSEDCTKCVFAGEAYRQAPKELKE